MTNESEIKCSNCKFANKDIDKYDDVVFECRRFPPIIFAGTSLSKFPRVLPNWNCGEFDVQ
jgi:hypothetical protein